MTHWITALLITTALLGGLAFAELLAQLLDPVSIALMEV